MNGLDWIHLRRRLTQNVDSPRGGRGARRKCSCAREHNQVVGGGHRQRVEGGVGGGAGHCQRLLVTGRERGPPSGPGEGEVVGGLRGGDVARHGLGLPHDEPAVSTDGGLRCGRDTTALPLLLLLPPPPLIIIIYYYYYQHQHQHHHH